MSSPEKLLSLENLCVHFPVRGGVFRKAIGACKAVDGVSFYIERGKTFGLVGESGCGKSTLAKSIVQLIQPTSGTIRYKKQTLDKLARLDSFRKSVQMVFQDPAESLNTRMTVGDIIQEPLEIHKIGLAEKRSQKVKQLLEQVGLPSNSVQRYPFEFSGGQRQRIGIARALALKPELLVLDEPVSALDVSVQSQILNLLMSLQQDLGLSYLLISHDLAVVKHVSDIIAVMYLGKIVEMGSATEIYSHPMHAYTKALLSAIPVPDPLVKRKKIIIPGDIPSPIDPPPGCAYGHRVSASKYKKSVEEEITWEKVGQDHWVLKCPCCVF